MEEVSTVVRMCQTHRQHNKDRTVPAAAGQPGGGRRGRVIGVRGSLWVSRFLGRSDTPEPHSACTSCSGCSPVEGRLSGLVVRNGGRGRGGCGRKALSSTRLPSLLQLLHTQGGGQAGGSLWSSPQPGLLGPAHFAALKLQNSVEESCQ